MGVFLGLIAGYNHGTWVDIVIMRTVDVFLALLPSFWRWPLPRCWSGHEELHDCGHRDVVAMVHTAGLRHGELAENEYFVKKRS